MQLKTHIQCLATASALVLGNGLVAQATSLPYIDVDVLAVHSDMAVEGEIVELTSAPGPSGHIETTCSVLTEALWGSDERSEITRVVIPGGEHNGLRTAVAGTPTFRVGDEVVLLLQRTPEHLVLTGMERGAFLLAEGTATRQSSVHTTQEVELDGAIVPWDGPETDTVSTQMLRRLLDTRFGPPLVSLSPPSAPTDTPSEQTLTGQTLDRGQKSKSPPR